MFLTNLEAVPNKPSQLDRIIPAEIKHDALYAAIYRLARTELLETVLEIGSSSGEGSTEAFVRGISENPFPPTLYCMEVSTARCAALKARYASNKSVVCYNVSSVPLESFPSEEEVLRFMKTVDTTLRAYNPADVIGWLRQDIATSKIQKCTKTVLSGLRANKG